MAKLLTRNHFYYIFIIALMILPLLTPGLEIHSLAIEPESFKSVVAVSASGILLLLWVISGGGIGETTRFVKTVFYLPVIAFLIWNVISLFWAVSLADGIFATVQYSVMALAFFLTFDAVYHKEDLVEKILILFVVAGFLVSIIGLLQIYFPDSQAIQNFVRQAVVPGSTFGNKNMSSHFLVMILPISTILLWRERRLERSIFFTTVTMSMLWFLFNTYTRTGLVALMAEITVFILFIMFDKWKNKNIQPAKTVDVPSKKIHTKSALKTKRRTLASAKKNVQFKTKKFETILAKKDEHINKSKRKSVIIFSGVLVFIIGINFTATGFQWNEKILKSAVSIISGDDNGRFPAWVNTLPMIRDHFIIGVGSGNWEVNYPYYYDYWAKDVIFNERIRLRRLHNSYLEVLANVGVIGFSFLLWLLFLSVRAMLVILKNPLHPKRYFVLGVGVALVGFSVSAMFSFPLRVFFPGVLTLVYIAIIAGIVTQDKHKNSFRDEANYFILPSIFTKLFFILLIPLSVLLIYTSYSWAQSGHYYQKAIERLTSSNRERAYDYALKSVEYAPYRARSSALLGDMLRKDSAKLPSAIYYLKKSLDYSPTNSLILTALADSYRRLAGIKLKIGDEAGHEKAAENYFKTLHRLIKLDPKNVKGYALLTGYHLRKNQIDEAKVYYNKMLKWADYFKDRNDKKRSFGPYDSLVKAIKRVMRPFLDAQKLGLKS